MKIKIFIIFIFLYSFNLYGQTSSIEEINRNIRSEEASLKELQKEKNSVVKQMSVISSKISNYKKLLQEINKEKIKCEANIRDLRKKINETSKNIEKSKKHISKSNMYIIDNMGYSEIKIIVSSERPENTVKLLEILGRSSQKIKSKIEALNNDIENLKKYKLEEDARTIELSGLEESRKKAVKNLTSDSNKYKSMLTVLKHSEAGKKEYIEMLKFQRSELDNELKKQYEKYNNSKPIYERENDNIKSFGTDKPVTVTMADNSEFGRLAGKLNMPVNGRIIEKYGEYIVPDADVKILHKGIKIAPTKSENVEAVAKGTVVFADNVKNFNNLVIIDHGSSYYTVYGNMDSLSVKSGQKISAGKAVGTINVDAELNMSYLYFELRKKEQALNPLLWFKKS